MSNNDELKNEASGIIKKMLPFLMGTTFGLVLGITIGVLL